jgi:hypothetical protein
VAVVIVNDELGAIHGVLIDSATGTPVPDVIVFPDCTPCGTSADDEGHFSLEGLEPGEYRLGAGNSVHVVSDYAFEYYDDASTPETAMPITVLPGEIVYIEWRLSRLGVIEGTVTDETTGLPMSGVQVVAVAGTDAVYQITDDAGFYQFRRMDPGDYIVCFQVPSSTKCWDDRGNEESDISKFEGDIVHVELGDVIARIDASMGVGGSTTTTTVGATTTSDGSTTTTLYVVDDSDRPTFGAASDPQSGGSGRGVPDTVANTGSEVGGWLSEASDGEVPVTLPNTGHDSAPIAVTAMTLLVAGFVIFIGTSRWARADRDPSMRDH